MAINRCYSVAHFRQLARRRLPAPMFHYIDGGADDEVTLRRNTTAFDGYSLMPSGLVDTSTLDLTTQVLGQTLDWPLFLAPTGLTRLFHHDGERAVARAAAEAGTIYSLSTLSSVSIEDIGALTSGPKMFQIYIHKDRGLTYEFIDRCKAAGYHALCLTVDTIVAGNRERDLITGMTTPPKLTLASLLSFALHPMWSLNYLTHEKFQLANVADRIDAGSAAPSSVIDYINEQFDRALTWQDAEKAIAAWGGPFAIKGIMSVPDARRAVEVGASAVIISNHGGRQLDSAPAPIDCVAPIVDAVGDKIQVILDGGVRRGTHVLKALALGAKACSMGRPYLYALAAGGQAGVDRLLRLLRAEIERDMAMMGCTNIDQVTRDKVERI
ncbi:MAG: alpha-hydroxy-acid oxidizing protein [Gammaproteobacteria bacterium]|nr:alpha-hydroxy-acid oxidizing protein [Gammaproteobacteria bacterium]